MRKKMAITSEKFHFRECCFRSLPENGRKLVWEITHKCLFGCTYCFQSRKRLQNPVRILHPSDLEKVIGKLSELDVKDVLLTGGEIYWTRDSLEAICSSLRTAGITYSVSTAFVHVGEFIDFLLSLKPRALNISLDPKAKESQEIYLKQVQHVETVLEKCQRAEIGVKATGVITRDALKNCDAYIERLGKLSEAFPILSSIYITNPYDIGYIKTNVRPSEKALREWLKRAILPSSLTEKAKFVNFYMFNAPLQACPAGTKLVHIEPDGNVYPCHLFANLPRETFLLGNLVNDEVSEIKKRLEDFGRHTAEAIDEYKQNEKCLRCINRKECGGGCVAELVSVGQLVEPQLVCRYIKPPAKIPIFKPNPQTSLPFDKLGREDLTSEEERKIVEYITQNMRSGHDLAHGRDHVDCVVRYARYIARQEGGNLRIVTAAAYFHDFEPRRKLIYESHAEYSAQRAVEFLRSLGFSAEDLEQIYHCIVTSSYGAFELGHIPMSIEAKCVRDADWIDAIGARGIARVFAFGSAHGCEALGAVEWSLNPPPKKTMSRIGPDPSPIYHFFSKLLWVKDSMATETGSRLAEKRHKRMLRFLEDYKEEMNFNDEGS